MTGLPYEECPQLWEHKGDAWIRALQEWAASKSLGVVYFCLKERTSWPLLDGFDLIVGGSTWRSDKYFHAVVATAETRNGQTKLHWVHDPYRHGDFIQDPDHCIFFVKQSQ